MLSQDRESHGNQKELGESADAPFGSCEICYETCKQNKCVGPYAHQCTECTPIAPLLVPYIPTGERKTTYGYCKQNKAAEDLALKETLEDAKKAEQEEEMRSTKQLSEDKQKLGEAQPNENHDVTVSQITDLVAADNAIESDMDKVDQMAAAASFSMGTKNVEHPSAASSDSLFRMPDDHDSKNYY